MKRLIDVIVLLIVLSLPLAFPGCKNGGNVPPEKSTEEKIGSGDSNERMEGVNEAAKKYGGGR